MTWRRDMHSNSQAGLVAELAADLRHVLSLYTEAEIAAGYNAAICLTVLREIIDHLSPSASDAVTDEDDASFLRDVAADWSLVAGRIQADGIAMTPNASTRLREIADRLAGSTPTGREEKE